MKGDILIIKEHHENAAHEVANIALPLIRKAKEAYIITIAGESGAGKSEIAEALKIILEKDGIHTYIFQQDDFFIFPPLTNAKKRREDLSWVGMQEVKLELLDQILEALKNGITEIEKPLVVFGEDRITEETLDMTGIKVILAEGTYTTVLKNADFHIFIDRDMNDTRASRIERGREVQDEFLEKVLRIEHEIISRHKEKANIIIRKDFSVQNQSG
ncbi:MAG: hypothetical protein KKA81_12090 [Bacteroidetes bacterium]|nr:hypothetical protein [Bacteroidota bacterium]